MVYTGFCDARQDIPDPPPQDHAQDHAEEHRLLTRDILGNPSLFGDISGLSTWRFLSCCCPRISPYNSMKNAFLEYADNAVYQICTSTVKSHCPKGTILVAAVPCLAHRFRGHSSLSGSLRLLKQFWVPMWGSWQITRRKNVKFLSKTVHSHCILIWQICKNMHPHRAPLCWWCHSASPL